MTLPRDQDRAVFSLTWEFALPVSINGDTVKVAVSLEKDVYVAMQAECLVF